MAALNREVDRIEGAAPSFKAFLTGTGLGNSERFLKLLASVLARRGG